MRKSGLNFGQESLNLKQKCIVLHTLQTANTLSSWKSKTMGGDGDQDTRGEK